MKKCSRKNVSKFLIIKYRENNKNYYCIAYTQYTHYAYAHLISILHVVLFGTNYHEFTFAVIHAFTSERHCSMHILAMVA